MKVHEKQFLISKVQGNSPIENVLARFKAINDSRR